MRDHIIAKSLLGASAFTTCTLGIGALAVPLLATAPPPATVAAPAAATDSFSKSLIFGQDARHPGLPRPVASPSSWTVRSGQTLSSIAKSAYGTGSAWWYIASRNGISASGVIVAGEVLKLGPPRRSYPAPPPPPPVTETQGSSEPPAGSGVLTYSQLEALWEQEDGSAAEAPTAACIAEHESGGDPDANNGADDLGLYQILQSNFPDDNLLDPDVNARDAVILSQDGTNWSDWSTAPDCGA